MSKTPFLQYFENMGHKGGGGGGGINPFLLNSSKCLGLQFSYNSKSWAFYNTDSKNNFRAKLCSPAQTFSLVTLASLATIIHKMKFKAHTLVHLFNWNQIHKFYKKYLQKF